MILALNEAGDIEVGEKLLAPISKTTVLHAEINPAGQLAPLDISVASQLLHAKRCLKQYPSVCFHSAGSGALNKRWPRKGSLRYNNTPLPLE